MTAKEDFIRKYPDMEKYQQYFACRYTSKKRNKVFISSKFYNGEKIDREAIPIIKKCFSMYQKKDEYIADIRSFVSDESFYRDHPQSSLIDHVEIDIASETFGPADITWDIKLTIIPRTDSLYLPADATVTCHLKSDFKNSLDKKFKNMCFDHYDPKKLKEYKEGSEKIIEGWKEDLLKIDEDPTNCPYINEEEQAELQELFSQKINIINASEIKQCKKSIEVRFQHFGFTVSETGGAVCSLKDKVAGILKQKSRIAECLELCADFYTQGLISSYELACKKDPPKIQIEYFEGLGIKETELSLDAFPSDRTTLLALFQREKERRVQEMKTSLTNSGCLNDPIMRTVIEIIGKNSGLCSKTTIYNITHGKQKSDGLYTVTEEMHQKMSLKKIEAALKELEKLGVINSWERKGSMYSNRYLVYYMTEDVFIREFLFDERFRTDHNFSQYQIEDWNYFLIAEDTKERTVDEWMELLCMWDEEIVQHFTQNFLVNFWKKAPDSVKKFMKYSASDQPKKIETIWKKIVAKPRKKG